MHIHQAVIQSGSVTVLFSILHPAYTVMRQLLMPVIILMPTMPISGRLFFMIAVNSIIR